VDKSCATTICTITGLKNQTKYDFSVTAWNANGPSKPAIGPVTGEPNAPPTAVNGLAVERESDHQITYRWTTPTGSFGAVKGYYVSWNGNRGYSRVTGNSKTISVANGAPVTFTVRAFNDMYAQFGTLGAPASISSGVASGKPAATSITSITGTNVAGGDTKAFTVSWRQVDPNGRGVTHYELFKDGAPVSCGGSVWTTSLHSCPVQAPNDGSKHTFRVRTANDAGWKPNQFEGSATSHQSGLSTTAAATAAGTPDPFGQVSLTPTGNNGEATLKFTVGRSHGKTGTVTCGGSFACSYAVGPGGGTFTKTISGLTNGQTSTVTLSYCNGADANAALQTTPCVTSQQVSAVTYGPLGQPNIQANANGTTITVTASGDANGAPAAMSIRNDRTGATHDCGTSDGALHCSWTEQGLAYSTTYQYTVTVTDASGHGRQTRSASANTTTGPPSPGARPTRSSTRKDLR
jgi:hypothetical protein